MNSVLKKCTCNDLNISNNCEVCQGKGEVIISQELISEEIKKSQIVIKSFSDLESRFDERINFFTDYGDNSEITLEATLRITNEIQHDLKVEETKLQTNTELLSFMTTSATRDRISELRSKGYQDEPTHLDLCKVCKFKNSSKCNNCINNLLTIYIEDCNSNFEGITKENQEWYIDRGYKLALY